MEGLACALFSVLLVSRLTDSVPVHQPRAESCLYDACPTVDQSLINVHLVPHSHDDVGWLKTVDQYYYGDRNDIQLAGVQYTLDSVVRELQVNPQRKFIVVETSFFWRWWEQQDDRNRDIVKQLVASGQLEFTGGGWTMEDEATTHYVDIIDQMTWGHRFLNDTFGQCAAPKIAWQIDPFGHSREQASLFAQMGFDGLFFARIDWQDRAARHQAKTMEFVWEASQSLGESADIFTGVFNTHYDPPPGFCFDVFCRDEPIMDDPRLKNYNVERRVNDFLRVLETYTRNYATNNIMMTMGSDFQYMEAGMWYTNLDKLIQHVNSLQSNGSNVNLLYSTPLCYLKALQEAQLTWPTKQDDFFPYASDQHSYWTGYFTSRAALKGFVRYGLNFLQVVKQLQTLAQLDPTDNDIDILKRFQGDLQHHDGVTGTEKQHVANDYAESLSLALKAAEAVGNKGLQTLSAGSEQQLPSYEFCQGLNVSSCPASESASRFAVTVYNPLATSINTVVRLPVSGSAYSVTGSSGTAVPSQLIPIPSQVVNLPERETGATVDLVFPVELPPLGFRTYFVEPTNVISTALHQRSRYRVYPRADDIVLQNSLVTVTVDGNTGLLKSIQANGRSLNVSQNFNWYKGFLGDNAAADRRSSGAYIFRPEGSKNVLTVGAVATVVRGEQVQEIQQTFNAWVSQVIRIYANRSDVEFEWLVGPIPTDDSIGKEIVTVFDTDLQTEKKFYTDANAREVLERVRDYRPTWDVDIEEPAAGNYYPLNSRILIREEARDVALTLVTDRAQGGASLVDGQLEVMLHRRLLHDDAFGVGEALDEPGTDGQGLIVRGKINVVVSPIADTPRLTRPLAIQRVFSPVLAVTPLTNLTPRQWREQFLTERTGLRANLPTNVHLLTLEQWRDGGVLIRLEHIYESGEDAELSQPATVNIQDLFNDFEVVSAQEATLSANRWLNESRRLPWKKIGRRTRRQRQSAPRADFLVTLQPMQIRTFVVNLVPL